MIVWPWSFDGAVVPWVGSRRGSNITKTLHLADTFVKSVPPRRGMVTPMRIVAVAAILLGVLTLGMSPLRAAQGKPQPSVASTTASQTVTTYCAGCHNGVMRSPSGVLLDQFDPARVSENVDTWTRAYRQLQAGTMPPVGAPRPDRKTYDALLTSIESGLGVPVDRAAPAPGASSQEIAVPSGATAVERRAGCAASAMMLNATS